MPKCRGQTEYQLLPGDMDFDITRTFAVLTATLVLPIYLALAVVSFSLGVLIL